MHFRKPIFHVEENAYTGIDWAISVQIGLE